MTHGRIALTLSLVIAAGLALAMAGRAHGRPGGGAVAQSRPSGFHQGGGFHTRPSGFQSGGFHHRPQHAGPPHFGRRPFVRNVVTFGAFAAPFVYAPPLAYGSALPYDSGYYDPSAYSVPPVSYSPPVSYGPAMGGAVTLVPSAPTSAPTPSVVEFPTGRYVLQGDGTTVPYSWVWIPNPPTAPPAAAPSSSREPSSGRQLYRWTDEAGVAHWTDRWDAVPPPYRAEAQQPRLR
ncbi:MAG TPA: hypothetical protein VK548_12870 [Candidatus Acidoferrum sp.]|nr:hypothetical protein [Candidatus Acidoferrum sp.]